MRWQPVRRATLHPGSSLGWACIYILTPIPREAAVNLHPSTGRGSPTKQRQTCTMSMFSPLPFCFASLRSDVYIFNSHLLLNVFLNSFCCLSPANPPRVSPICKGVPSPETGPRKGPHWTSFRLRPHLFQCHELRAKMRWRLGPGNLGPTFFANLAY